MSSVIWMHLRWRPYIKGMIATHVSREDLYRGVVWIEMSNAIVYKRLNRLKYSYSLCQSESHHRFRPISVYLNLNEVSFITVWMILII